MMSDFQTMVDLPKPLRLLDFDSKICSIGSCFSMNFSSHLASLGVAVASNPSGIIYNVQSMQMIVEAVSENRVFVETDFFEHQGLWKSWLHHGVYNSASLDEILFKTNKGVQDFRAALLGCDLVLLTPSSSMVYQHQSCEFVAANCHRVPNSEFDRHMLSVDENYEALKRIVKDVRSVNPNALIIFTLSPVRHYSSELTLNSQSKANLLSAIHQVVFSEKVCYFPSYEVMMDELRDYRFYKDDLLHPSELALKVIYQKFMKTYFTTEALKEYPKRIKQAKLTNHRPRNE